MTLGELILALEKMPQDLVVSRGFCDPHSDRGFYDDLAFTPTEDVTVASVLACAREAVGKSYGGYKGGEYVMGLHTTVFLGRWGEMGEEITEATLRAMLLERELENLRYDLVCVTAERDRALALNDVFAAALARVLVETQTALAARNEKR